MRIEKKSESRTERERCVSTVGARCVRPGVANNSFDSGMAANIFANPPSWIGTAITAAKAVIDQISFTIAIEAGARRPLE